MTGEPPDHEVGYRKPPRANRFSKGRSGNPTGRPRRSGHPATTSAFDIFFGKTVTFKRGGQPVKITIEEALQHKALQSALAGSKPARREVIKMILRRDEALAKNAPPPPPGTVSFEPHDPDNADKALMLLGIAEVESDDHHQRQKLLIWAVQAALNRRRRPKLNRQDLANIKSRTLDPEQVSWPSEDR